MPAMAESYLGWDGTEETACYGMYSGWVRVGRREALVRKVRGVAAEDVQKALRRGGRVELAASGERKLRLQLDHGARVHLR